MSTYDKLEENQVQSKVFNADTCRSTQNQKQSRHSKSPWHNPLWFASLFSVIWLYRTVAAWYLPILILTLKTSILHFIQNAKFTLPTALLWKARCLVLSVVYNREDDGTRR